VTAIKSLKMLPITKMYTILLRIIYYYSSIFFLGPNKRCKTYTNRHLKIELNVNG